MQKDKIFQMASKITEDGLFETQTASDIFVGEDTATKMPESYKVNAKFLLINYCYESIKRSCGDEIAQFLGVDEKDVIEIFREPAVIEEKIELFVRHPNGVCERII